MKIKILAKAEKEFDKFPFKVQAKFETMFNLLASGGDLDQIKFKKLKNTNLFEFRVRNDSNTYRGIAVYILPDILLTLFFQKKSQKTPLKFIKTAQQRFKNYES